jgi:hypothetical protein
MNPGEGWGSLNTPRYIRFAQYDKGVLSTVYHSKGTREGENFPSFVRRD